MTDVNEKSRIVAALYQWIGQRPGLEWGNYSDSKSYRSEMRRITNQLHDARDLLRFVAQSPSIDAVALKEAFTRGFSGRLSWDGAKLDYCAGQYWPTEYRAAACGVLASVVWTYFREPRSTGDSIRAAARRCFGRGIQSRWFN